MQTERRLRDHELTHGEKQVECPDCKRKFHNHTQLYRHNQRVHVEKQMLICDYCRKGFKVKSELMLHIRVCFNVFDVLFTLVLERKKNITTDGFIEYETDYIQNAMLPFSLG